MAPFRAAFNLPPTLDPGCRMELWSIVAPFRPIPTPGSSDCISGGRVAVTHSDTPPERRAIVIGGSVAGMVAARVLAGHFDEVMLIDRDRFPATASQRAGVPQARHIHVLLMRGQRILFTLFPELEASLVQAGAVSFDWAEDALILGPAGYVPRFHSGLRGYNITRDGLEHAIRASLARVPRVHVLEAHQVVGLESAREGADVGGVWLRARGTTDPPRCLAAALTVDASGRDSRAVQWLAEQGYPAPRETVVNSFFGYASTMVRWLNGTAPSKLIMTRGAEPKTRSGVMLAVEGGLWQVTLGGAARDFPPTDYDGLLAFADSLPLPHIATALREGELARPITGYRRMENRRRHFEMMPRWPQGFVATGDAVCAFNPAYGQGMTTAALGGDVLDRCLRDITHRGLPLASVARRFQQALAASYDTPWVMATSEDYRFPETEGGRRGWTTRLAHWYLDRVMISAATRPETYQAFLQLTHMIQPPSILLRPSIAWHALARGPA
jgi:2-polyprenyl-6-methoxyphenol hydroxylase-like FAD-dependent oxidoreductase